MFVGYSQAMDVLAAWPDVPSNRNSLDVNGQVDQTCYNFQHFPFSLHTAYIDYMITRDIIGKSN